MAPPQARVLTRQEVVALLIGAVTKSSSGSAARSPVTHAQAAQAVSSQLQQQMVLRVWLAVLVLLGGGVVVVSCCCGPTSWARVLTSFSSCGMTLPRYAKTQSGHSGTKPQCLWLAWLPVACLTPVMVHLGSFVRCARAIRVLSLGAADCYQDTP